MPKIFGTSLWGILAATIIFYLVGFLIYGLLFAQQWLEYSGMSEAQAQARSEAMGSIMYIGGLLITFAQVLGLSWVLNYAQARKPGTCMRIGAVIAALFALPILAYSWLYEGASINLLGLDFVHLLIGYVLACLVLSFFRGREA